MSKDAESLWSDYQNLGEEEQQKFRDKMAEKWPVLREAPKRRGPLVTRKPGPINPND